METGSVVTTFMRHQPPALCMDGDKLGSWAPFCVAFVLLSMAGWGLWTIPENAEVIEGDSQGEIPRFVEHFPMNLEDDVPLDDVLRISWHPEDSELGTLKTNDRYLELVATKKEEREEVAQQERRARWMARKERCFDRQGNEL